MIIILGEISMNVSYTFYNEDYIYLVCQMAKNPAKEEVVRLTLWED